MLVGHATPRSGASCCSCKCSRSTQTFVRSCNVLEMFSGGGRWRGERRSADAWRDMDHSSLGYSLVSCVALPEALVFVIEQCFNNFDAAHPGHELMARHAAHAAATACACDAVTAIEGLQSALAGAMHANVALALQTTAHSLRRRATATR